MSNIITRTALYIRVSTEEQALNGDSIETQEKNLIKFAKDNQYKIIDIYKDEGYSARKPYHKRKEFVRLLNDVKEKKIDLILFTKLDRWFRNVANYYEVQKVLDKYNVSWKCTQEEYNTTNANGRLALNIKLSIAQDEADRTSERIKTVFQMKIEKGEAITGTQPWGYKIGTNKKIEIDEEQAKIVQELFNKYEETRSIHATYKYYINKYNDFCSYDKIANLFKKSCYAGIYKNNKNYYPIFICPEQYSRIQQINKSSFVRNNQTNRIYIFSGLLVCKECGHRLEGNVSHTTKNNFKTYRCKQYSNYKNCSFNHAIREDFIEKLLLLNSRNILELKITNWEIKQNIAKKNSTSLNKVTIKNKLEKLKNLYLNDLISLEDYKKDYDNYNKLLNYKEEIKKCEADINFIRDFLKSNYEETYKNLDEKGKQRFWKNLLTYITIDKNHNIDLYF